MNTYDVDAFKEELREILESKPDMAYHETEFLTYETHFDQNEYTAWENKLKELAGYKSCPVCGTMYLPDKECTYCINWKRREKFK